MPSEATDTVKWRWRNTGTVWKVALVIGLVIPAILAVAGPVCGSWADW